MKKYLKFSVVFILGIVIGGVIAGYLSAYFVGGRFQQMTRRQQMRDIRMDIRILELYRNKGADRYFNIIEKGIPDDVLMVSQNDEMKESEGRFVLEEAKRFYLCTKTPIPKQIKEIIEAVKLEPDFSCNLDLKVDDVAPDS